MSHARSVRGRKLLAVASATVLATVGWGAVRQHDASAASNYGITLTKIGVGSSTPALTVRVAALTANQQVTLVGTNFDEGLIASISLGTCTALTSYIVVSSTSILVKTPATCAVSSAVEDVTITEVASGTTGTVVLTGGIFFAAPPAILALASRPVVTENSVGLVTNEVQTLIAPGTAITGLQKVRIRALATTALAYEFDARTAAALSITIGGKALTALAVYNSDGTAQTAAAGPAPSTDVGNWVVGTLPTTLASTTTPTLGITQSGVTKSFTIAATGISWYSGPTVTSLDVNSGKAAGGTAVKITGTGFDTVTLSNNTVDFCGVATLAPTASTGTGATGGTSLTVASPVVAGVAAASGGLGATVYAGVCAVTVALGGTTSPVTAGGYFAYLSS